jgi:CBS domain containing-hemolysin-like protein
MPTAIGLTSVVALVLANAFFVATEFALVGVRRARMEQLATGGNRSAIVAQEVLGHLDAYIAACQFGITLASLALGWVGEPALAHLIEPLFVRLETAYPTVAAHTVASAAAFAVITALHIVAGELAPKGIALQKPEATTLWIARPIRLFYRLFRYPITVLNAVGNGVLRLMGFRPAEGHDMVHSAEELALMVDASQEAGVVEESEARIANRAFRFADTKAGELMTPRAQWAALPADADLAQARLRVRETGHTSLVVYDGSPDDVVGLVHVQDLLLAVTEGRAQELRALVRPAPVVPESRPADAVLEDMRQAHKGIAIVVDEYGSATGLITLHDLLEGLVGPIDLEVDRDSGTPTIGPEEPDGSRVVNGLLRIAELEELTGARVEPQLRQNARTVGGLVVALLGKLPDAGETVEVAGWSLAVEELRGPRVSKVRLRPPPPPPKDEEPAEDGGDR